MAWGRVAELYTDIKHEGIDQEEDPCAVKQISFEQRRTCLRVRQIALFYRDGTARMGLDMPCDEQSRTEMCFSICTNKPSQN